MFTSRNIHFAILGIILGSAFGYILAFYQVQASMPPPISGTSQAPPNHPEVTNEQMLALFKQALDKNPNEPELLTRYASFMFSLGRFTETTETLQKLLTLKPNDMQTMEDLFLVHLGGTHNFAAAADVLKKMEKIDPKYASLPDLKKRLDDEKAKAPK
jgi:tetratricopeptide (TPR) repeat protein